MSNYPVLWQNVLGSLASPLAQKAFIWAAERPNADRYQYRAEEYAREVDLLVSTTRPMMDQSAEILEAQNGTPARSEVIDDLMAFMLKRHAIWRFGNNVKTWIDRAPTDGAAA